MPPALIDACMSFKIDQLPEVRTAPAAHEGHRWQEGPVRLPQAGPAMARHSWAVWWPMMAEGRQRPTSSILAAIAQRRAVRLMMVGRIVTVRRRGSLCRCTARSSTKLEMRKTGGRSRGGSGGSGVGALRRAFASSVASAVLLLKRHSPLQLL